MDAKTLRQKKVRIMKTYLLLILVLLLAAGLPAQAQEGGGDSSSRASGAGIDELADRLKRYSADLLVRAYADIKTGSAGLQREIERAFTAQQFDASVGLFQQMLGDERSAPILLDAVRVLRDLTGNLPKSETTEPLIRNIENTVREIERELRTGRGPTAEAAAPADRPSADRRSDPAEEENGNLPLAGRAFWRGMVDNKVHLLVRGNRIETRTVEGQSYPAGTYTFTAVLPERSVAVGLDLQEGRGRARVFQQPAPENDFTAIIEIEDPGGGAREYRLEIFWK